MDFTNRSQSRANTSSQQSVTPTNNESENKRRNKFDNSMWFKVASVILLFSGTILVIAVLLFLNLGTPSHENRYIDKKAYQAVFVNVTGTSGGQVYFGHVTDMSEDFVRMTNVFYIQNQGNNANSNNSYNLVKLGCELHGPQDEMVINRDQIFFWENLKSDGQVTKKIAEYYQNNSGGQKCSDSKASNSTQQSATSGDSSTNDQPAANNSASSSANTNNKTDTQSNQ
jgi:hypothetical protein